MENKIIKNGVEHQTIAFLAVPFPPQGHLTAILNFTYLLTNYGFPVHVAAPGLHTRQAKLRLQASDPEDFLGKIQFHDLPLPHFSSPAPNPNQDPSVQFPDHLQPLFDIIPNLRQPVFELVAELAQKFTKLIVIHDYFMAYVVQDAKTLPNVELYNFIAPSAFTTFFHYWESMPHNPFELGHQVIDPSIVPTNDGCFTPEFVEFMAKQEKLLGSESGFLINTSRVIEGTYVDLLESLSGKRFYAVGPFHPIPEPEKDPLPSPVKERNICLQWLDKQETESSVILVTFGSATTLHDKQIEELAIGLERSGQKFIWALRSADKGNEIEGEVSNLSALPEGYEDRIKDRGIVVREWVPQLEILAHRSTGGFLSHCGWLSCMESMSMGVPIATWPIHSDHPKTATFVTEVLRIGVVVRDWAKRSEIVKSITIENAVRKLMAEEEGLELRKNVQRIGVDVLRSMAQGGASRLEMDSFVARVTK